MATLEPVISAEDLALARSGPLVLVDASAGPDARKQYEQRHLEGALHVDLEHELANPALDAARGGRHPLPDPGAFATLLGRLGIRRGRRVVVYDDKGGANAAARLWWMLRAVGHDDVQVLDGGIEAAVAAGVPLGKRAPRPTPRPAYPLERFARPTAQADEVERAAHDPGHLVIDVRDPVRYRGETDPFDPVPGHVPGAINAPFSENLGSDGRFVSAVQLAAKYRALIGDRAPENVIVHCGSGVTACHTLLAMERAGIVGAKLYVGSWSEWSRSGRPVAKGSEPG